MHNLSGGMYMSDKFPKIASEDIDLGVEAAWDANRAVDRIIELSPRVVDILEGDEKLRTTAVTIALLGKIASNPMSPRGEMDELREFSKAFVELDACLAFGDMLIGRNVPGSDTLFASHDGEAEDFLD
jgi:hypothetical protein